MVGCGLCQVAFIIVLLLAAYVIFWAWCYVLSPYCMFFPPKVRQTRDRSADILLQHANGEVIVARCFGELGASGKVILYQHGNGEDIASMETHVQTLHTASGLPVLAYEYRGYGGSDGKPTLDNMREDGDLAWNYLRDQGVEETRILLYGRSLGGANASRLALEHPKAAGLILEVAPWDAFGVLGRWFITPKSRLENGKRIRRIQMPTLILYAKGDRLIRPWHAQKLFRHSAASFKRIQGFDGGHVDVPSQQGYSETIAAFVAALPET